MKKATLLKFINPLLFLSVLVQISTILLIKINPVSGIILVHEFNGFLLGLILLFHLVLNWSWIRSTYFPRKSSQAHTRPPVTP